ncbi:MAG TPA: hypothetical protein VHO73_10080 [Methylomirabilota bacterium]|nr:hypothetical protein [Methylomirabilota bacterium]
MALLLRKQGVTRIRPLAGGYQAWTARGFPTEAVDGQTWCSPKASGRA